jgi:uncharacterized protein
MAERTQTFDLGRLQLRSGEARRLTLGVHVDPLELGGDPYSVLPEELEATLDLTRMTAGGWSMRLRFTAEVHGPCMRCLGPAGPAFDVDAREIDQPGGGPELDSPYVQGEVLDVAALARDALVLALPSQIVCAPDCAGLCPGCGARLADLPADHAHEPAPDARWAKLDELRFD